MKNRQTKQKELIEEEIKKMQNFFSVEDLLKKVTEKNNKIGIATIYRYLKEMKKKDKIYTYTCSGKNIYSNSKTSHCHFICTKTGKTFHFQINNLDFLKDKIPGEIESFQIEVKGICNKCDNNTN